MATNVFEFLYWTKGLEDRHLRVKFIRARNVKSACRKFMRLAPKGLLKIDYEVRHNKDCYTDISEQEEVKDYI